MKIVMFTNTFTPHVGGVAHSVAWLAESLRDAGHGVLVVAPEFPGVAPDEENVVRIPAVQNFGGSDFSAPLPLTRSLREALAGFAPDLVHSHHPFLLGDTALRVSAAFDLPVVYTYHTRYELYGHYVAQDSPALQRLVLSLATGYCDLCDAVIAPSRSMAEFLIARGVTTPTAVVPTGIDTDRFGAGDGRRARSVLGIPEDAFVVGHVGRLAQEKNLGYLAVAVRRFLAADGEAHFLVVGDGPMRQKMQELFDERDLAGRVHLTGALEGERLASMYAAMDAFVFSSHSETQGLVLAEAMAAGIPVVALDAFGSREVVRDRLNGRLLASDAPGEQFAEAIGWIGSLGIKERRALRRAAHRTAQLFTRERSIGRALELYRTLAARRAKDRTIEDNPWQTAKRRLEQERKILGNVAHAIGQAVLPGLAAAAPNDPAGVAQPGGSTSSD